MTNDITLFWKECDYLIALTKDQHQSVKSPQNPGYTEKRAQNGVVILVSVQGAFSIDCVRVKIEKCKRLPPTSFIHPLIQK